MPVEALNILANCEEDRSTRRASSKSETEAVQRAGTVQVCAGLATAVYLRQHDGKGVLRTGKIVPGTAWVVEMLEVRNSYVCEASKPAMSGLHAVGRTEFKGLRSFRNLHRGSPFQGFLPSAFVLC